MPFLLYKQLDAPSRKPDIYRDESGLFCFYSKQKKFKMKYVLWHFLSINNIHL